MRFPSLQILSFTIRRRPEGPSPPQGVCPTTTGRNPARVGRSLGCNPFGGGSVRRKRAGRPRRSAEETTNRRDRPPPERLPTFRPCGGRTDWPGCISRESRLPGTGPFVVVGWCRRRSSARKRDSIGCCPGGRSCNRWGQS